MNKNIEKNTNNDITEQMAGVFYSAAYYLKQARISFNEIKSFLDLTGNIMSPETICLWNEMKSDLATAKNQFDNFEANINNEKNTEFDIEPLNRSYNFFCKTYDTDVYFSYIDEALNLTGRVVPKGYHIYLDQIDMCFRGTTNFCNEVLKTYSSIFLEMDCDNMLEEIRDLEESEAELDYYSI